MKIAVISDTHDNISNLEKALNWINQQGIEIIIHCGDVFGQGTLEYLANNFPDKIYVSGDSVDDDYSKRKLKNPRKLNQKE